jgi:hypothetical protein
MKFFKIGLLTLAITFSAVSFGQDVKPLRLGVRLGAPSLFTANVEYVTPLLDNRVSVIVDYMSLNPTVDEVSLDYSNFEIGSNIYLNNTGRGLYLNISYLSFDAEGTYPDVEFDDNTVGTGVGKVDFSTMNLKLGFKFGRTFFTRFEVGYGFGSIPVDEIVVQSIDGPGQSIEEIPSIPGISSSGTFLFSIGFGVAFL